MYSSLCCRTMPVGGIIAWTATSWKVCEWQGKNRVIIIFFKVLPLKHTVFTDYYFCWSLGWDFKLFQLARFSPSPGTTFLKSRMEWRTGFSGDFAHLSGMIFWIIHLIFLSSSLPKSIANFCTFVIFLKYIHKYVSFKFVVFSPLTIKWEVILM